jgi:hypothetical protein
MSRQNSARADGKKVVSFCVLFSLYINFIKYWKLNCSQCSVDISSYTKFWAAGGSGLTEMLTFTVYEQEN